MKVLVDTSIWSLALRRKSDGLSENGSKILDELKELISEVRTVIVGPVRQEILSGISSEKQFIKQEEYLSSFIDYTIHKQDYELAAEFFNRCRKKGVQGSQIDFLIAAVAYKNTLPVFTLDKDFFQYKKILRLKFHKSRY